MRRIQIFFILFFLLCSQISTVQAATTEDFIRDVQTTVSPDIPTAPNGFEQKGFVGEILSRIFNTGGNITNDFVEAFKNILTLANNNVPKWNNGVFQESSIWEVGGNVGIGNSNPQFTLDVNGNTNISGDIRFSGDLYQNGVLFSGDDKLWEENGGNIYRERGSVGIGISSPSNQLHTTGTARFDGGVLVDNIRAISDTNASHTARPSSSSTHTGFGVFEVRNKAGEIGGYFGGGNGGDRITLGLDRATKLNISGGEVGIGVSNPGAKLHVAGNIISDNPTEANHLTTKNYVDAQIGSINQGSILPRCSSGEILKHNGTEFVCEAESSGLPASGGCNWTGWKCSCNADTRGTESISVVGSKCEAGVVQDIRVLFSGATSGNVSCPSSWGGCSVYEFRHDCAINPVTNQCL